MNLPRRQFLHFAAGAAVLPVASIASAQAYPSRPITIIAPFAAGGPVDARARILAEHMRQTLGQSVIVENVTGAAGSIGVGRAARASRRPKAAARPNCWRPIQWPVGSTQCVRFVAVFCPNNGASPVRTFPY